MQEPARALETNRLVLLVLAHVANDHPGELVVGDLGNLIGAVVEGLAMLLHALLDLLPVEAEAEHAEAAVAGHLVAVGRHARHPHGRMGFLNRLGHDPARWNFDQLAVVLEDLLGPGLHDNLERLAYFVASAVVIDAEAVQLLRGGRAAGAELHAAIAHDVEDGGLLRHLYRIVELEREEPYAVGDSDVPGALADRAIEDLGRGAVRVLFEEMMLDLPDVVDSDAVGEFDLCQRFPVGVVFT